MKNTWAKEQTTCEWTKKKKHIRQKWWNWSIIKHRLTNTEEGGEPLEVLAECIKKGSQILDLSGMNQLWKRWKRDDTKWNNEQTQNLEAQNGWSFLKLSKWTRPSLNWIWMVRKNDNMKKEKNKRNEGWVTGNTIGTEGAKSMSEMLKTNTTLTSLNLGSEEEWKRERERKKWRMIDSQWD